MKTEPITATWENWTWKYEMPPGCTFCHEPVDGVKSIPIKRSGKDVIGYAVPIHLVTLKEVLKQNAVGLIKSLHENVILEDGDNECVEEMQFGNLLVYMSATIGYSSVNQKSSLSIFEVVVHFAGHKVILSDALALSSMEFVARKINE